MTTTTTPSPSPERRPHGRVSAALFAEMERAVTKHGVVLWCDPDARFVTFIDALLADGSRQEASGKPAWPPIVAFRGSFVELLLALPEDEPPHLLVHVPGFDRQSVEATTLLELASLSAPDDAFAPNLDALARAAATGLFSPADVDAFLAEPRTLEALDAWLEIRAASGDGIARPGLSAGHATVAGPGEPLPLPRLLQEAGRSLVLEALVEGVGAPSSGGTASASPRQSVLASRAWSEASAAELSTYLHKLTGLPPGLLAAFAGDATSSLLERHLNALAAWLLAVEFANDLSCEPHDALLRQARAMSRALVDACRELLDHLRDKAPEVYARRANEVEGLFADEIAKRTPAELGHRDTFRGEESRVLEGAVLALANGEWAQAQQFHDARSAGRSFWLARDERHRFAWTLVGEAASFGAALATSSGILTGCLSLSEVAERYAERGAPIDRAHRRFEQVCLRLLVPQLPHFGQLREVLTDLRRRHRAYADELSRAFSRLCQETSFLPEPRLQQRTLFEQVVLPLTQTGEKVAVFLVDAFRYEMATELCEELAAGERPGPAGFTTGGAPQAHVQPRFAELPTLTSVGMNAIAPVAHGEGGNGRGERLSVQRLFEGFRVGEYVVHRPLDRARAMGERASGKAALGLSLASVCQAETSALSRKLGSHALVVVHSKEIDDAGEANLGVASFESTLQQLKSAFHHLQLAGVRHFVFTADHGFLLQDETTQTSNFGATLEAERRHIVDASPRQTTGVVAVPLASLGYEGPKMDGYLLLRDDTAVFSTGVFGATFVHGGNSLQERIIPVLTVHDVRAQLPSQTQSPYEVELAPEAALGTAASPSGTAGATPGPGERAAGLSRMRLRLVLARAKGSSLSFVDLPNPEARVELGLRAVGRPEVRIIVKEVSSPGQVRLGRLQQPVGGAWSEIAFTLEGPVDERVRVEVFHPDSVERVTAASTETWFPVSGTAPRRPPSREMAAVSSSAAPSSPTSAGGAAAGAATSPRHEGDAQRPAPDDWAQAFEDEAVRGVFLHIAEHGAMTESEIVLALGSPRAFRKFSQAFDDYVRKLPFLVRVKAEEAGKRYEKESDR